MAQELLSPLGRIVWGNPTKLKQKRDNKRQLVFKDGQPVMEIGFGIAFPIADFVQHVWPVMWSEAASIFPNPPPNFAWKFKDGTGGYLPQYIGIQGNWAIDRNGKQYSEREGYAGCVVLNVTTQLPLSVYKREGNGWIPWTAIKCGDYVAVKLSFKANKPSDASHTPGMYVNPEGVIWWYDGPEIRAEQDPDEMFAGASAPPPMPAGASATPRAPGAPGMPQPGMPQPGMPQPGMPQPGGYVPPQQPAHDFVHTATGGYVPGMPQPGMPQPGMPQPGMPQPGMPQPGYVPGR